jgi:hypothetical protein
MVFATRRRLTLAERLRGWLWPYIGWRRAGRYLLMRVQRMPGTPHGIAAGIAAGVAVSFTPFLGFHFLLAFGLAWAVGGNYLAAALGTLAGNPWTFPFMFALAYELGCMVIGREPTGLADLASLSLDNLLGDAWRLFWPMAVGAVPLGIAAWLLAYFPLVRVIAAFQERRRNRIGRLRSAMRPSPAD